MDRRAELVELVTDEVLRVLPDFEGDPEEYAWLLATYGVTEEEDVQWSNVLAWDQGEFESDLYDEEELAEHEAFLDDDAAVIAFLEGLLLKYRSSTAVVPHEIAEASAARAKARHESITAKGSLE